MNAKISALPNKRIRNDANRAPRHLKAESRRFYEQIVNDYILENHHRTLLRLACEAFDRSQEARRVLAEEGLVIDHPKLGKRPHPCISVERDSRLAVARLLRELNLSEELDDPRPPGLKFGGRK